jgi:hypothetical protein
MAPEAMTKDPFAVADAKNGGQFRDIYVWMLQSSQLKFSRLPL